jgi:hypothetical protein
MPAPPVPGRGLGVAEAVDQPVEGSRPGFAAAPCTEEGSASGSDRVRSWELVCNEAVTNAIRLGRRRGLARPAAGIATASLSKTQA